MSRKRYSMAQTLARVHPWRWAPAALALFALFALPLCARPGLAVEPRELAEARGALRDELYDLAILKATAIVSSTELPASARASGTELLIESLCRAGRYHEAIELEVRHEAESRDNPAVWSFWGGFARYMLGRHAEAAERMSAAATSGDPLVRDAALRFRALALSAAGLRDEADAAFALCAATAQALDVRRRNLLDWGLADIEAGNTAKGMETLQRLIGLETTEGGESVARLELARLLLDRKDLAAERLLAPLVSAPAASLWAAPLNLQMARLYEMKGSNVIDVAAVYERGIQGALDNEERSRLELAYGLYLLRAGESDAAARRIRQGAAADPNSRRAQLAFLYLAWRLLEDGDAERAAQEYRLFLQAYPDTDLTGEAHFWNGWALYALGRYSEAATTFAASAEQLAHENKRRIARFKSADALFQAGAYKRALSEYEALTAADTPPEFRHQARFQMAELYVRLDESAAAIAILEALRQSSSGEAADRAAKRLADLRIEAGEFDAARAVYSELLLSTNAAVRASALLGRADVAYRRFRFDEALRDYLALIEEAPNAPEAEIARYRRGLCLYGMGRDADAVAAMDEFRVKHPTSPLLRDALLWRGRFEFNRERYEDAAHLFREFAERYGDDEPQKTEIALLWKARCAERRKDMRAALDIYTALLERFPSGAFSAEARFRQGDLLAASSRFAAAILVFEELIALKPGTEMALAAWGRKGDCQFVLGAQEPARYEESIASFRVVAESAHARPDQALQAEYKIGKAFEKLGQTDKALEQYHARVAVAYETLVRNAQWTGRGAQVWFVRACFDAADILERAGRFREAAQVLARVARDRNWASAEASERIQRIRRQNPTLFRGDETEVTNADL